MRLRTSRVVAAVGVVTALALFATVERSRATTPTPPTPSSGTVPPPLAPAGVIIDADGVLHRMVYDDASGELMRRKVAEAHATLNDQIAAPSKLRKVSLTRLAAAIAARREAGQQPTDEMACLAGLTRLRYVFLYPESGDIVIAGPAEGWVRNLTGRVIGLVSGHPILELEDLVVALRAYPPGEQRGPVIGCSIDPTPEGLGRMQEFLRTIGREATPENTDFIVEGLRTSLGLQKVAIRGVSPKTHFAQIMVEADYRMKLIGIGLEHPPVAMASYVDRVNPATVSRNALQRWYFVPDYKCVRTTDDHRSCELIGDGVKLVGADEVVGADGRRAKSGGTNRASETFVRGFTKKYPELAARSPVFAQLRNLIDMSVAAAFMQEQDFYGQTHWNLGVFASEETFPVETHNAPVEVESAVNSIWKGNQLMTPIGGGVHVEAHQALTADNLLTDDGEKLEQAHQSVKIEGLAEGQWWWD